MNSLLRSIYDAADGVPDAALRAKLRTLLRQASLLDAKQCRERSDEDARAAAQHRVLAQAVKDDLITREAHEAAVADRFCTFSVHGTNETDVENHRRAEAYVRDVEAAVAAFVPRAPQ